MQLSERESQANDSIYAELKFCTSERVRTLTHVNEYTDE